MQILLEHHGRLTPSDCQSVLEDKKTADLLFVRIFSMFWITKSGPVSSTWISLSPAISCNTNTLSLGNTGGGDPPRRRHHQQQQCPDDEAAAGAHQSAFSGFGLALAGRGRQAGAGRGGRRGSADLPIDLCRRPSLPLTTTQPPPPHHPPPTHSYTRPRTSHFFLIGLIFFLGIESYDVMNEFGYRLTTFPPNLLWLSSS